MAKGSEQFTWAAVGGKRPCETCRASIPTDRVRVYSSGVTRDRHDAYVVCADCWPDGWLTLMHKGEDTMNNTDFNNMQERQRAAALQEALGIGVQASGEGYAIVDYHALDRIRSEHERLREALRATRDWIRYAANSDGGIVAQTINAALGEEES